MSSSPSLEEEPLEYWKGIPRDENVFGRFGSTGLYEGDSDKVQNSRLVAIVDAFKTLDLTIAKIQRTTIEYAILFAKRVLNETMVIT